MRHLSLTFILFLLQNVAHAFEVDVFKSGMSRQEVKEAIKSYSFDRVQDFSTQTLIAYDQPEKGSNRQFVFDFCNDKLSGLQQEMGPSFRSVTIVLNSYLTRHGQPFLVKSQSNATNLGDKNEISFYWRKGLDILGVKYSETAPVEQLLLQFEVPNNCWQTPR